MQPQKDGNDEGEDDDAFMRRITYCEEERRLRTSAPWCGGYRWFRSPNVVPIEQWRRTHNKTAVQSWKG
jgi:hypothetical protein